MKKPTSLLALAIPTRTVTESAATVRAARPAHSVSERKSASLRSRFFSERATARQASRPFFTITPLSVCHSLGSQRLTVFEHAGCAERSFEPLGSQVLAGH